MKNDFFNKNLNFNLRKYVFPGRTIETNAKRTFVQIL